MRLITLDGKLLGSSQPMTQGEEAMILAKIPWERLTERVKSSIVEGLAHDHRERERVRFKNE